MENASKALIIAGAILIAILLISIGILIVNSNKGMVSSANEVSEQASSASEIAQAEIELTGNNVFTMKGRTQTNLKTVTQPGIYTYQQEAKRIFTGNGIYIGLTGANYYQSWRVVSDSVSVDKNKNSVKVIPGTSGYGVGFDIKVKPNTKYKISGKNECKNKGAGYIYIAQYDSDRFF